MNKIWGLSFLLLLHVSSLLLRLALSVVALPFTITAAVPALFIFGDSTVDVGTNNYINSWVKANHPPYGIDFPGSIPTGRFSNGFNTADSLAKKMGFETSPPPFLSVANQSNSLKKQIVHGVNFASGGSGLLDITGLGGVITFGQQVKQFETVRRNLTELLGEAGADSFLNKSIIFISVGSNDIFLEFFVNRSSRKSEFINSLRYAYQDHLKTLYSLGARKFSIASVPAIGCCPSQRATNDSGVCLEELNDLSQSFYSAIEPMLQKLGTELEGMKYSIGDSYKMMINVSNNPIQFGLTEVQSACCGAGKLNGQGDCKENATVCVNRNEYMFWDWYHPTEAAAELAAKMLYNGTSEFVTPINFKQLLEDY